MNESNYCGAINVYEIIKKHLEDNGFDGLYHENDCGCEIADLMPCGDSGLDCTPGYKKPTPKNHDQYGEVEWIIGPKDNPPRAPVVTNQDGSNEF